MKHTNNYIEKLITAIQKTDIKTLRELLESGIDANTRDQYGRSALIYAVVDGNTEVVKILIENKADINMRDNEGWTALHAAAEEYRVEIAKILLNNGAEVDAQDSYGNTPLFRAIINSRERGELIKLLLQHGADKNMKNYSDVSPHELAENIGNYDIKQFLDVKQI
ncbi:MAG: ankyrin repeat domain-containing protein [Armatimonadota bacterium]